MAEFSEDLPNFSISHNLFSNSNANERVPPLPEEELVNLRSKDQNQNTSNIEYKNLAEGFQRVESAALRRETVRRYHSPRARCNSLRFLCFF